jgi:hypothetical protein
VVELNRLPKANVMVIGRMDESNGKALDFIYLPEPFVDNARLRLSERNVSRFENFRALTLDDFYQTVSNLAQPMLPFAGD